MSRKTFVFHLPWLDRCRELGFTQGETVELIRAIFNYARTGDIPAFSDRTLRAVFLADVKPLIDEE